MSDAALSAIPSPAPPAPVDVGWGRSFRIFQPRSLASWVFLWYLILGAVATFQWFEPGFMAVRTATGWGFLFFGLYAIPWIWFLRHFDRWTPVPAKLLVFGFLWGGLTATFFIAITGNTALLSIYNKAGSASFAQDWGPALAAPFTEETGKGIGILLLMFIAPRLIRTPFDGFILGAFVGLGFQIIEDVLYAVNSAVAGFGVDQASSALHIFILRGIAGFASHALFSAIYGTGLVYLIGTSRTPPRRLLGLGLIVLAMLAHGVWDGMAAIAGEAGINAVLMMLGFALLEIAAILIILRWVSRGERATLQELMTPEVTRGTISNAELSALSGGRKDRKHFLGSIDDRNQRTSAEHVLSAATDLAAALSRSGGQETPGVAFARSEVLRLRESALPPAAA